MERAVVAEANLVKLRNEATPPHVAALLGCAVPTGMGMVFHLLDEEPGSIAIYGMGGVGSTSLLAAQVRGYAPIFAIDIYDHKLQHARSLGATYVINANRLNPLEEILRLTDGKGVDYAIECSGNARVMEMAFSSLKNKGKAVIAGNVKSGEMISINPHELNMGKKLFGTFGGDARIEEDIPFYEQIYHQGKIPIEKLISKIYGFNEVNTALSALEKSEICRPIIEISPK